MVIIVVVVVVVVVSPQSSPCRLLFKKIMRRSLFLIQIMTFFFPGSGKRQNVLVLMDRRYLNLGMTNLL